MKATTRSLQDAEPSGLLQLPPEVLHRIWQLIYSQSPGRHDLLSMRCTCKQLREVTATFISNLDIIASFCMEAGSQNDALTAAVNKLAAKLDAFPAHAQLKTLYISAYWGKDGPMPGVLHTFFNQRQARLTHLISLTIRFWKGLTHWDFAATADACRALQRLDLQDLDVCGAAFAPLSKLRSLSRLSLRNTRATSEKASALESLRGLTDLTALTSLTLQNTDWIHYYPAQKHQPAGFLCDASILPWLSSLHALRELHLTILNAPDGPCEELGRHISGLQHLTSLTLEGIRLPPDCQLACASKLLHLAAGYTSQAPDVRLYASLPSLKQLRLHSINLDTYLSHLPCLWDKLTLDLWPSPAQLVRLPVKPGLELSLPDDAEWCFSARDGLATARVSLQRAAAWLGMTRIRCAPWRLIISWDEPPDLPCSDLLPALSAMDRELNYLTLGSNWPLHADDVRQGAQHLPGLVDLEITLCDAGYNGFLDALARVPWPMHVIVACHEYEPDEAERAELQHALQELALRRARNGHSIMLETCAFYVAAPADYTVSLEIMESFNELLKNGCPDGCSVRLDLR